MRIAWTTLDEVLKVSKEEEEEEMKMTQVWWGDIGEGESRGRRTPGAFRPDSLA